MKSRFLFAAIAIVIGVVCVRLGLWQLDRREQRRARNAAVAARSALPAMDLTALRGDTSELRFRRAGIRGVADYEHELVLGNRTRDGAPGVNFLTPVRIPGTDTAYLVNRGWVYSPDAATPAEGNWREADTVAYEGYVDALTAGPDLPVNAQRPRYLSRPVLAAARARIPYPVAPLYLVARQPADSARPGVPARISVPAITDEGSHFSYAVQWFFFATVAFVGAGIALRQQKRSSPDSFPNEESHGFPGIRTRGP